MLVRICRTNVFQFTFDRDRNEQKRLKQFGAAPKTSNHFPSAIYQNCDVGVHLPSCSDYDFQTAIIFQFTFHLWKLKSWLTNWNKTVKSSNVGVCRHAATTSSQLQRLSAKSPAPRCSTSPQGVATSFLFRYCCKFWGQKLQCYIHPKMFFSSSF